MVDKTGGSLNGNPQSMAQGALKEVDALAQVLKAVRGLDETQQRWVFASAASNLGLEGVPTPVLTSGQTTPNTRGKPTTTTDAAVASPKEFLKEKKPQSDVQRVACLAYYLAHYREQPQFKTKDIVALNVQAAGTKIGNASQAVDNATKGSHYLAPAGGGTKQITAFGEDVVDALPDQTKVKAVEQVAPRKRRGGRRRAGPKR